MCLCQPRSGGCAAGGRGESAWSGPRAGDGPSPRPSRRSFSPEYKLAILAEYESAPNGEKGAVLRREGLYSSHVIEWARARDAGALDRNGRFSGVAEPVRRSAESVELERLRARNAKLEADLVKTRTALEIMGKAHALLGQLSESAEDQDPPRPSREVMDTAFTQLRNAQLSTMAACALTGRSRATHYRRARTSPGGASGAGAGPARPRRPPPCTITEAERAQMLAVLNSEPYRDLAIPQVWARELDEGRYWCSSRACTGSPARPGRAGSDARRRLIRRGCGPNWSPRPEPGVELGHHRLERPTERGMVQAVRRARHFLPLCDRVAGRERRGRDRGERLPRRRGRPQPVVPTPFTPTGVAR